MKDVAAVFFDFGGTLFDSHPSTIDIWVNVAKKYGKVIHPSDPKLINAISNLTVTYEKIEEGYLEGRREKPGPRDWLGLDRILLEEIGINDPNAALSSQQAFESRIGQYKIFPDSKKTLKTLKEMQIRIGLISNVSLELTGSRWELLREHSILHLFDTVILSSEVGYSKPDENIFKMALKELAISDPGTTWHVGDSIVADAKGARKVGIVPILFDPLGIRKGEFIALKALSDIIELVNMCNS